MFNPYNNTFRVTSPQGPRTLDGVSGTHNGLDLVGGTKDIYSITDGVVVQSRIITDKSNLTWQWGNYIAIQDKVSGKLVYYCHLSQRLVSQGQSVKAGDKIGVEGSTGYSTGSHLHLEVRIGATPVSASDFTGIPNAVGTYGGQATTAASSNENRATVISKSGISELTAQYLDKYTYPDDLWRKLAGMAK